MEQTLVLTGDLDRLLALEGPAHASRGRDLDRAMALGLAGRYDEARRILDDLRAGALLPAWKAWLQAITAWVDRQPEGVLAGIQALEGLTIAEDPEGLFQVGLDVQRPRRARTRGGLPAARGRPRLLRGADDGGEPGVR
jgi:hypothetical protein